MAEVDWEMKAIIILFVFVALAIAALAAQPVTPAAGRSAVSFATEPVWMILSGAALLVVASAVRRYLP